MNEYEKNKIQKYLLKLIESFEIEFDFYKNIGNVTCMESIKTVINNLKLIYYETKFVKSLDDLINFIEIYKIHNINLKQTMSDEVAFEILNEELEKFKLFVLDLMN